MIIRSTMMETEQDLDNSSPSLELDEKSEGVDDVAALVVACTEISQLIRTMGHVGTAQCAEIIMRKSENVKVVKHQFPGAIPSAEVLAKVSKVIERRGYTAANTLFAQSICPDEINHDKGDITSLFKHYLGEVFHLGGLAGIPFTGKTGFSTFSDHVPDDGHCFVLMAPHVGLDDSSEFGKYSRAGQSGGAGIACSAAIGAFAHCCSNEPLPDLNEITDDYQMAFLTHQFDNRKEIILAAAGTTDVNAMQSELAKQTHAIATDMLDNIVNANFGGEASTLVILTGIQINMPRPFNDYFQPLSFYIIDKEGHQHDLYEDTFGIAGLTSDSSHQRKKKKKAKRRSNNIENQAGPSES